jgi:hypothetical protein
MVDISAVINNQYPHFLYKRTSGQAVQNANGSWVTEGAGAFTLCGACREETNGKGNKVQAANGVFREFSALVQIPVGVERIPEGTEIVVTTVEVEAAQLLSEDFVESAKAEGIVRISGECLKFDEGRLHSRLWV